MAIPHHYELQFREYSSQNFRTARKLTGERRVIMIKFDLKRPSLHIEKTTKLEIAALAIFLAALLIAMFLWIHGK